MFFYSAILMTDFFKKQKMGQAQNILKSWGVPPFFHGVGVYPAFSEELGQGQTMRGSTEPMFVRKI